MTTEEKFKKLTTSIEEYAQPQWQYVECGTDVYICPFCRDETPDDHKMTKNPTMDDIEHFEDCPYMIVKSFKENNEKERK